MMMTSISGCYVYTYYEDVHDDDLHIRMMTSSISGCYVNTYYDDVHDDDLHTRMLCYSKYKAERIGYCSFPYSTHTNEDICKTVSEQVRQDLIMSGFVPKNEKSKWSPLKKIGILGYSIDTYQSIVKIPDDRIQKVLKTIEDIEYYTLKYRKVHARLVASLVGQIVSMSYVIGNVAYIMSKHLSIDILEKTSWNSCIVLSKASLIQINFWKENLGRVNVKSFT
ncbi:unnamed protein product [Mytilus edulis]|uniref:Uncharacterized protein n=1 Tax=Mytilus edulis TaxID=6550 RepID=A0A8S3ULV7_MYTED|nr:unnamed protein product [Mytilus edulis]